VRALEWMGFFVLFVGVGLMLTQQGDLFLAGVMAAAVSMVGFMVRRLTKRVVVDATDSELRALLSAIDSALGSMGGIPETIEQRKDWLRLHAARERLRRELYERPEK
jgi:drug/metabolite transporter (DMT)-like permease